MSDATGLKLSYLAARPLSVSQRDGNLWATWWTLATLDNRKVL